MNGFLVVEAWAQDFHSKSQLAIFNAFDGNQAGITLNPKPQILNPKTLNPKP